MFNDLRVSNTVSSQVPQYYASEYPNFVNFLKDYYAFLETNSNALDLLNNIGDLINVETYTGIDISSVLYSDIEDDSDELLLSGTPVFAPNGLIKIDDEVILYKNLGPDLVDGEKVTRLELIARGYIYNSLEIDSGFTANIQTVASAHTAGTIVYNQSYIYLFYFLEKLREQYLPDFPKNVLEDNLNRGLNIDAILKRVKDFYITKGTPQGIDFYFKFLFQETPELRNFRDSLTTPSNSIFEGKRIVRFRNLDNYPNSELQFKQLVQGENEFTVISSESLYTFTSLAIEYEISNSENIVTTEFTKIVSEPDYVFKRLYVDGTDGFPESGIIRYGNIFITYSQKQENFFVCDDSIFKLQDLGSPVGKIVFDLSTLCVVKDNPEFYFSVYSGITEITGTDNVGYTPGDAGFISYITLTDDPILTTWSYNNTLPVNKTKGVLSSVTNLYYSNTDLYLTRSKAPFELYPGNPEVNRVPLNLPVNTRISPVDKFVKIPRNFVQRNLEDQENTIAQFPVALATDGIPIINWKSNNFSILGKIQSINIENGGSQFNVANPPLITIDPPTTDEAGAVQATAELKINGHLAKVNIEDGGSGYPTNVSIFVDKGAGNDPNITFRQAVVSAVVVSGKITKIRIIDPGSGYTTTPTITITPAVANPAQLSALIEGFIYNVNITNAGAKYTEDPQYNLVKGIGATASVVVTNGRISAVSVINRGSGYNSPPRVTLVDSSGNGVGGEVIAKLGDGNTVPVDQVESFVILNPGLNYGLTTTSAVILESGKDEVLNIRSQRWTPVNNYAETIQSDGSYQEINGNDLTYYYLGIPENLRYYNNTTNSYQRVLYETGEWTTAGNPHSPIIGWAFDGAPIYGPFGYSDPLSPGSAVVRMVSGYKKKQNIEPIRSQIGGLGLGNFEIGYYAEDWEWIANPFNLDENNGRFCITPEYPDGVYAYFMTHSTDANKNRDGFPYFIGPKYRGKTENTFNIKENRTLNNVTDNLSRYVSKLGDSYILPEDPGNFVVEAIPESTDSTLFALDVVSGGDLYKIGDTLVFDNEGTGGFGASGFVSSLKGKEITQVTKNTYDFFTYDEDTSPFISGSVIKTNSGFQGTVIAVDSKKKEVYVDTVSSPISIGENVFDDINFINTVTGSKTSLELTPTQTTINLTANINSDLSLIAVDTVAGYQLYDYFKIDNEIIKVIFIDSGNLLLGVIRGVNNSIRESHETTSPLTLIDKVTVYNSNQYVVNDIISLDNEYARIVEITVENTTSVQAFDIIEPDLGGPGPYYVYFDQELQSFSGSNQDCLVLDGTEIQDIQFDATLTEFDDNVLVEVSDSPTYGLGTFFPVEIVGTTQKHTLDIERGLFGTAVDTHTKYTNAPIRKFITAKVSSYEEDKIITTFTSSNTELVPGDDITVTASLNKQEVRDISVNGNSIDVTLDGNPVNPATYAITNIPGVDTGISFYENYDYFFTTDNLDISFFGPSTNEDGELVPGRKYFDITIDKTFDSNNRLTNFVISPDDSDLTSYFMVITNPNDSSITKTILVKTLQEPINDNYKILTANSTEFSVVNNIDPENADVQLSLYNSNTISYTTTSKNAKGPINFATLSSGGFSYITAPGIKSINSDDGIGAIISPLTKSIGLILNVEKRFSGYGFSSDFRQKPVIQFPRILQISNNFTVTDVQLTSIGSNYLFDPRVVVTGGGLPNNSEFHAEISATYSSISGNLTGLFIVNEGQRYNSAPDLNIEKYYFTSLTGTGIDTILTFKFAFNNYILQDDQFKVRLYYTEGGVEKTAESDVFFAKIEVSGIECRANSVQSAPAADGVDPRTSGEIASIDFNTVTDTRYEYISLSRVATAVAIVSQSTFSATEKIIINNDQSKFGFVTANQGWQPSSSTLRVERFNSNVSIGDIVFGESSKSTGVVTLSRGTNAAPILGTVIEKPKSFLTVDSFLGSNFERIQDSFKYQRFSYEIGVDVPFSEWKENYIGAAHPTGYNIFARTTIKNTIPLGADKDETTYKNIELQPTVTAATDLTISTDVSEEVSFRRKYNYLVTKSQGLDEVQVYNRQLTDIKETEAAIVAVFEDFSEEFDGAQTSFELKVVDPLNPTDNQGNPNYIEDYDVDQMVILLDNVIQTYGTSWFVTASDKNITFTSSRAEGQLLPEGESLTYRKVNETTVIYESSEITTADATTFSLLDANNTPWPAGIFSVIDLNNYLVLIDGVVQLPTSAFTISGNNNGEITFTETIPEGSEISVRYFSGFLNNTFENVNQQSYTSGTEIVLANTPPGATSNESYFVFVDGALMSTDVYTINGSKNIVFNDDFNYFTLMVFIDPVGVSLTTKTDIIIAEKYTYKIEDGQEEIPEGFVVDSNSYIVDIAGVIQSPSIVYDTLSSGVRKINFTEPPYKTILSEDNPNTPEDEFSSVGRQFIGLLYQRSDPEGNTTTPNYQFDDISQNIIQVKEDISNFVIGDNIVRSDELSFGVIKSKSSKVTKIIAETSQVSSVTAGQQFTVTFNTTRNIFEGDRVIFNAGIGLTSPNNDELEIVSIDRATRVVTLENISGITLNINIPITTAIDFVHNTFEIINLNIDDSIPNKDNGFVDGDTILSGLASSQSTGVISSIDDASGLRLGTAVYVVDAGNISGGALTGNAIQVFEGSDYTFTPNVTLVGGSGEGATATATVVGGQVTQIALSGGTGYDAADLPAIIIEPPTQSILTVPTGEGALFLQNDYILINDVEICKIANITGDQLTIDRSQLNSSLITFYVRGTSFEKIIPQQLTVKSFRRGFDGEKTVFKLTEQFEPVTLPINSDIFVILNGILQNVPSSYTLTTDTDGDRAIEFVSEPPKTESPCNIFYLGQTISVQDVSTQFNGSDRIFELRDPAGEIFSFNAKNKPEANISANLIIFIDGVYQIPSVEATDREPAYDNNLASYRLFGSVIEFSAAPKFGSSFEAYIYVGSDDDYNDVDIDPPVEAGDVIIQDDQIVPRDINNILSSTRLSVNITKPKSGNPIEFFPNLLGVPNLYFSDIIQLQPVRESLRSRQLVQANVVTLLTFSDPVVDLNANTVEIETIQDQYLPAVGEGEFAEFNFIIPATTNFPERFIDATYGTIAYDTNGTNETLSNVVVGAKLPFDQIIVINSTAPELFDDLIYGSEIIEGSNVVSRPIINTVQRITYGPPPGPYTDFGAKVVNWDPDNGILFLKLDSNANPAATSGGAFQADWKIRIEYSNATVAEATILDNDLIAEYQTLAAGTKLLSTT